MDTKGEYIGGILGEVIPIGWGDAHNGGSWGFFSAWACVHMIATPSHMGAWAQMFGMAMIISYMQQIETT